MVLKELTELWGVSGDEGPVRDYVLNKARALAEVEVDRMGNVIARKKGTAENPRHVVLAAHMDEVGLMITGVDSDGSLKYSTAGGIDARVMPSKRVLIGEKRVPGVVGAKAIHLQSEDEYSSVMSHHSLRIDIGAKDKDDALKYVSIGDYAMFDSQWVEFGAGLVKAKALDDRVGVNNLLSILEGDYPCDVTCVFTVQEEVGLRGAQTAMWRIENADCAIILEGTTANDLGDVEEHLRVCAPGKGVAISFMDNASISDERLWKTLRALAQEKNIAWQMKTFVSGGNDAGAFQTSKAGLTTAVLSVPCRYIHSPSSVAAFSDIEAQYALVDAFLSANAEINSERMD